MNSFLSDEHAKTAYAECTILLEAFSYDYFDMVKTLIFEQKKLDKILDNIDSSFKDTLNAYTSFGEYSTHFEGKTRKMIEDISSDIKKIMDSLYEDYGNQVFLAVKVDHAKADGLKPALIDKIFNRKTYQM